MRIKLQFLPLALLLVFAGLLVVSCGKKGNPTGKPDNVDYYTCTMHPSVRAHNPHDKCPICGMDLVPVLKKDAMTNALSMAGDHTNQTMAAQMGGRKIKFYQSTMSPKETSQTPAKDSMGMEMEPIYEDAGMTENQPGEFTVPVERQQQIGVTFANVQKRRVQFSLRAVGLVAVDKQRHWDYVARVDGYVKKLFVFSRGEMVDKDSPLLTIYSPDFLTTENEFMDLIRTRDEARTNNNSPMLESTSRLVDSAKERLRLWNLTDAQIAELEKNRQPMENLTLVSPFHGVVQDLDVDQGRHVSVGDHLVDLADLSVVWVWAQFYQDELPLLKKGSPVTVTPASFPGEKFEGKISVIDPFVNDASRTVRVRIDVENPDFKLLPDMYADVGLNLDNGESLAVPLNAVLPTGKHNIVFVDRGEGRLEPRFVEVGRQFDGYVEIKSGLKENERVVSSANFLIDAESQVQGALKSW